MRGLGEVAAKFGVTQAPTLLVACNGSPDTAERFEGEFKSGPIGDFLAKFAGGRKCAAAIKVRSTLANPFKNLRVSMNNKDLQP